MTERQLTNRAATIVIGGHFALFAYGVLIFLFGRMELEDLIQTILISSPVVAMTGLSAIDYVGRQRSSRRARKIDRGSGWLIIGVLASFLVLLIAGYSLTFLRSDSRRLVSLGEVNILLGLAETGLGAYIARVRNIIFPPKEQGA